MGVVLNGDRIEAVACVTAGALIISSSLSALEQGLRLKSSIRLKIGNFPRCIPIAVVSGPACVWCLGRSFFSSYHMRKGRRPCPRDLAGFLCLVKASWGCV